MILSSIFNWGSLENPSTPLSGESFGGGGIESAAGVQISREAALKLSAFWRGVNLRSDYIARLPLEVKKKTNKGKQLDTKHPAYKLLMYQPNAEQNAFAFKKTAEAHQIMSGNGYIYIRRLGGSAPSELLNLDPDNTWPVRVAGRLWYTTRINYSDGRVEWLKLKPEDVIHLKGLGFDGLCGYPFLRMARETLGLGIAANEYASRFFRNNAEPRVIITVPGTMPPDAQEQFAKQWNAMHQGLENSHRTAILTNNATVTPFSLSAKDSQLLDQRKFTLIEIANMLGLPPHKVGASDRIAYNSLEQENQAFADDTLEPRMKEWELETRNKLLTEKEKESDSHIIRFDRNELVRADLVSRSSYLKEAVGGPWMTIDEGREAEGMNPLPGAEGDKLLLPEPPQPPAPPQEPAKPESEAEDEDEPVEKPVPKRPTARNAHESLLVRTCCRLAKRVALSASGKTKTQKAFLDWVDARGVDAHRSGILDELECMRPAFLEVGVDFDPAGLTGKIVDSAQRDLHAISSTVFAKGLPGAVDEWSKRFTGPAMEKIVGEVFSVADMEHAA